MALQSPLTFCLLAAALCILQAQGRENVGLECCTAVSQEPYPISKAHLLKSHEIQGPQMGCSLPAIVLITKRGRELCFASDDENTLQIVQILKTRKPRKPKQPRKQQRRQRS